MASSSVVPVTGAERSERRVPPADPARGCRPVSRPGRSGGRLPPLRRRPRARRLARGLDTGRAHRFPWTTCAAAVDPLRALEGTPLSTDATAAGAWTDPRANCTHLFDLAGLT